MLTYILFNISDTDLKTRQIPNRYIIAICVFALACAASGLTNFSVSNINIALAILILSSLFVGMGDAKLFAALSLIFGPSIFIIAFLSFSLAGAFCLLNVLTKNLNMKDSIAFAPFIAAVTLAFWIGELANVQ